MALNYVSFCSTGCAACLQNQSELGEPVQCYKTVRVRACACLCACACVRAHQHVQTGAALLGLVYIPETNSRKVVGICFSPLSLNLCQLPSSVLPQIIRIVYVTIEARVLLCSDSHVRCRNASDRTHTHREKQTHIQKHTGDPGAGREGVNWSAGYKVI